MSTRTNIILDDDLVAQAMVRAKVTTKKAAVEAALRAYVRKPDYSGLLALAGTGVIADDYDPKALFTHPRYGQSLPEPAHIVSENLAPWPANTNANAGDDKPAAPSARRSRKA